MSPHTPQQPFSAAPAAGSLQRGGTASPSPAGVLKATALEYASRLGWYVFPLWGVTNGRCDCGEDCGRDAGKHPIAAVVPNGQLDASRRPELVDFWWSHYPNANIGVAVKPSGLAVLDVDVGIDKKTGLPKGGAESLRALIDEAGTFETLHDITGSGGLHAFFTRPPDMPTTRAIRFRPGLDWLTDGYVVAPPSMHACGKRYEWQLDKHTKLEPVPPRLAAIVTAAKADHEDKSTPYEGGQEATPELWNEAWQRLLRHGPSMSGQGGDEHAYKAAAILINDYDLREVDALALLVAWNDAFPENHWKPEKLAQKLRHAARYAKGERGKARTVSHMKTALESMTRPFAGEPETPFLEELKRAWADLQAWRSSSRDSDGPKPLFASAAELFNRELPRTQWLVQGLVPEGSVGVISGEPKSNKTWGALELAIAIASSTPAFGEFATFRPKHVALFMAEDSMRSLRNRMRAIVADRGLETAPIVERIHFCARGHLDLMKDEDVCRLIASVRALPESTEFVLLDPLRDLHSGNEDSSGEMAQLMANMRSIRDLTGATVCFVHHAAKSSGDSKGRRAGQRMRGSSAIHGAIDFGIYLYDLDTDNRSNWINTVEVEIKAAAGAGLFRLELAVTDDENDEAIRAAWRVDRDMSKPTAPTTQSRSAGDKGLDALRDAFAEVPAGRCTSKQELRQKTGLGWRSFNAAMSKLEKAGEIYEDKRGGRSFGWLMREELKIARQAEAAGAMFRKQAAERKDSNEEGSQQVNSQSAKQSF